MKKNWPFVLLILAMMPFAALFSEWLNRKDNEWRAQEWRRQYNAQIVRDAGAVKAPPDACTGIACCAGSADYVGCKTEHITPAEFRQKMGIDHPESNKRTR